MDFSWISLDKNPTRTTSTTKKHSLHANPTAIRTSSKMNSFMVYPTSVCTSKNIPSQPISSICPMNNQQISSSMLQSSNGWSDSLVGQHSWSQNIPSVMPWTTTNESNNNQIYDNRQFSFTSMPMGNQQQIFPQFTTNPINNYQQSNDCDLTIKKNNKRTFNHLMNDPVNDYEFDFDNNRPIKKYICEDKVLEIFDRLHIREGEQYIVEDSETKPTMAANIQKSHNLHIEELIENDQPIIEFSPELKEVLKNKAPTITEKLIQAEQDKLKKALVIWQPNCLIKLLSSEGKKDNDNDDNDETDGAQYSVKVEEVDSSDEETMQDDDTDMKRTGVQIEPLEFEYQDHLME